MGVKDSFSMLRGVDDYENEFTVLVLY